MATSHLRAISRCGYRSRPSCSPSHRQSPRSCNKRYWTGHVSPSIKLNVPSMAAVSPRRPAAPPAPSVLIDPQGDPSTYCGTFGTMNQTGCCPLNETCSGVGRCPPGDTECPGGGCCPSGAVCVAEGDGTLACDYGPRPDDYLVGQALVKSAGGVFLPMLILVGGGVGAVVVVNS